MRDLVKIQEQIRLNPNAVICVWPVYTDRPIDDSRNMLLWGWSATEREIVLRLGHLPIYFKAEPGEFAVEEAPQASSLIIIPGPPPPPKMKHWGLTRLGPGVWAVSPSVHLPGAFHGYITLCEVPEPAPWSYYHGHLRGDLR